MYAFRLQKILQGGATYEAGGIGGKASASKSSTKSSYEDFKNSEEYKNMTPYQQKYYQEILDYGQEELRNGLDTTGSDKAMAAFDASMKGYNDVLQGGADQSGLNDVLAAQQRAATEGFKGIAANIGSQANMGGSAGGSRGGIAQGNAASEADKRLTEQQNATIYQSNQDHQNRKMQASQGAAQVAAGYQGYQQQVGNQNLDRLAKGKELYSGDMGSEQRSTAEERARGSAKSSTKTASASAGFSSPSDERLKKDIKPTGKKVRVNKTGAELDEMTWKYTDSAKDEFNLPGGEQKGIIAQDLKKEDPDAIGSIYSKKDKKGNRKKRMTVDNSKITDLDDKYRRTYNG
jgi:hypothetical protein